MTSNWLPRRLAAHGAPGTAGVGDGDAQHTGDSGRFDDPRTTQHHAAPGASLVHRHELDGIAWQVLLRDGHLVRLTDDIARPAAVPETPALRAAALAPLVPARCALAREAAVWVHLGGPPPARAHVVACRRDRRPEPAPGRVTVSADLADRDVVRLGGVRVTTLRRTAVDVLAHEPRERAIALVERLQGAGLDLTQLRTDIAGAAGRRGVRAAADLLRLLSSPQTARTRREQPSGPA